MVALVPPRGVHLHRDVLPARRPDLQVALERVPPPATRPGEAPAVEELGPQLAEDDVSAAADRHRGGRGRRVVVVRVARTESELAKGTWEIEKKMVEDGWMSFADAK